MPLRRSTPDARSLRLRFDEAAHTLGSTLDVEQQPAADRLAALGAQVLAAPGRPRPPHAARSAARTSAWRSRNARSSSRRRRSHAVTSRLHLLALHEPHAGTTLSTV